MAKKLTILVTDGENRSSLAVTRSLGKCCHKIIVSSKIKTSISASSKYCFKSYILSDPLSTPKDYSNEVIHLIRRESVDVVYPMTEATIYALNNVRKEIEARCILASVEADQFDTISNKFELFQRAKQMGLSIPETLFVQSKYDLKTKIDQINHFPVVVKPGRSKIKKGNSYISASVRYARSKGELIRLYDTIEALDYPSMIQEKIQGPGTGLFTLFDEDKHLALFSHQRIREKPPSGGVSVVCQSVPIDPEMAEASNRLLASVKWRGVAMVEFKRDLTDGQAKLMEINGRFWGSLQLAISSGVDFPLLLLDYLHEVRQTTHQIKYQAGLKLKWLLGTLDHLLIRLKTPRPIATDSGALSYRFDSLMDFLRIYDRMTTFDVLKLDDMKPFISEVRQYVKDLL
ncbi:ATP-grasp domain-containing protein [Desulfosarcina ovata]|uniref:ATP-grasp domain-containing protein n=1 Tax=Desulfosarcina ovata subsp. ovata TaxID=2752305 RepID=A0A5K8A7M2_9BACT|nr:ATP-grasp domain-containing protein [Desulfosarcina ovata]BBO88535.1 hypothetical protein DSCOOX_17150 [Desulfosarcina ovata subsp. ovata]